MRSIKRVFVSSECVGIMFCFLFDFNKAEVIQAKLIKINVFKDS